MSETQSAQEVLDGMKYKTEEVLLLQYIDGIANGLPEETLALLYKKARQENILDVVFPQGVTLNGFIRAVSDKHLLIGYVRNYNGCDLYPAGFGWTWQAEGPVGARKATIAFVFYREFWGKREIRALSRLAFKYWFEEAQIDVLFGALLRTNRLARIFAAKMGFKILGDVPKWFSRDGKLVDGSFVMLTKEDFLSREAEHGWSVVEHNR